MSESVYITTPIYYVNDVPHLGHAYTTVAADALARWHRSCGRRVRFVTGTDEHGQKIERAAAAHGEEPIELADRVVARFRALWEQLHIAHDDFIRTTEPRHQEVVRRLWSLMSEGGDIEAGGYEGLYCTGCEAYKTDKELDAEGRCPDHGTPAELLKEPSYFFKLERYRSRLLDSLAERPERILPEARRNKILADLSQPLGDLSISRTSFSWGVPVPGDDAHVMYVWLDALTNYISALGWPDGEDYGSFWADCDRRIHLIGKDILWFHTVYWPSFLMSAGLPLATTVFAHGWWTVGGKKMSKTLGNVVDPGRVAELYGSDALRYFLLREVPFGADGDFSKDALVQRINSDLANDLGNLANRTLAMTGRWCEGVAPTGRTDRQVEWDAVVASVGAAMDALQPHKALEAALAWVRSCNRDLDARAPWSAHKEGRVDDRDDCLADTLEGLRRAAALLAPFMPVKMAELCLKLGLKATPRMDSLGGWGDALAGVAVHAGEPLFPRIDPDDAPDITGPAGSDEPEEAVIDYEDFTRVALKVGVVRSATPVEGADRLLQLEVDVGEGAPRSIVAGIAEAYAPADVEGRRVVVVTNLAPRKIRGVLSQGMVLASGAGGGDLQLVSPDGDPAPGEVVR